MFRCAVENCPFYGTPDQDNKCSHCSGRLSARRTTPLSEEEALEAMGWEAADVFPSAEEFEERMLWMRTTQQQLPFLGTDNNVSVDRAIEFIGLERTKSLSVAMALRVWNEVVKPRWLNGLAFQKALVRLTMATWLLPHNEFGVGLCYFGRFGDGPTEARFVRNYVSRRRVSYSQAVVMSEREGGRSAVLGACEESAGGGGGD